MLEFDLPAAFSEILKSNAKTVLVQLPEGLKARACEIVEKLEAKTGVNAIVWLNPCFGACDIPEMEAKKLNADLILHFGHSKFHESGFPTVYVPVTYKISAKQIEVAAKKLEQFLKKKGFEKISLATTAQYLNSLPELKKFLEMKGFNVFLGKGPRVLEGQLLGCNYSAVSSVEEKIDVVVFFGDGLFHPQIACFGLKKPVLSLNLFDGTIAELSKEHDKFLRKRFALIELAKKAKVFGIMVSAKSGQNRESTAILLKKEIEQSGKKAIILAGDLLSPDFFLGIKVDALIDTACPRIALDDSPNYRIPVLTAIELEIVLGKRKWENFEVREFY